MIGSALKSAIACAVLTALAGAQSSVYPPRAFPAPQLPAPGPTISGTTWINSPPLSMKQLRGQVVLVDFWEFTCINCIRTLDVNKRWYRRYHRYGFTILGVHDPEFDIAYLGKDARRIEHDPIAAVDASHGTAGVDNVRAAVRGFGLPYPVVVDDWFKIWDAYHNQVWPNRFLIDANGFIRYNVAGEGGDAWLEHAIRQLLRQAHPGLKLPPPVVPRNASRPAYAPGCGDTTPEMYIGDWYGRGVLANRPGYRDGQTLTYHLSGSLADGRAEISGRWETDRNGMIYRGRGGKGPHPPANQLQIRYHARELYGVLNVAHGHPERVYIEQDGRNLIKKNAGADVRFDRQGRSYIEVRRPRLYYLVVNPAIGEHSVSLYPSAAGLTVNSFTFGNNCQQNFSHLKG